jgi:hypothetical protein
MEENKTQYYNGLSDGLLCTYNALSVLLKAVQTETNVNKVKLMIVQTVNAIAEIMTETNYNLEKMMTGKDKDELG